MNENLLIIFKRECVQSLFCKMTSNGEKKSNKDSSMAKTLGSLKYDAAREHFTFVTV